MSGYVLRRLGQAIPVFLGVTFVAFLLLYLTPGDPVELFMGQTGIVSPEEIARVRREFGLDRPFLVQYGLFLGGILRGDLGQSIIYRRSVVALLGERLPATIELTLVASLIALLVAIPAGVVAAVRRNTWLDAMGKTVSLLGVSLPGFWLGLILILVFSVTLRVLPVAGRAAYGTGLEWQSGFLLLDAVLQGNGPAFVDLLRHLVMPAVALSAGMMAMVMRLTRSSLLETIHQDYVRTARAKGVPEGRVVLRHALRNALLPVVTTVALNVGTLLGGNMVIETVFSWPGLGRLVVEAVEGRDYPLIRACVLVYAVTYVLLNLIADLSYAVLDPRIAVGGGGEVRTWAWRAFRGNRTALVGAVLVAVFSLMAVLSPWIVPHDPTRGDLARRLQPPAFLAGGEWRHPLGTDNLGWDLLSRIIAGSRVSISLGLVVVVVCTIVGVTLGLVSGYVGGWVDTLIQRTVDVCCSPSRTSSWRSRSWPCLGPGF